MTNKKKKLKNTLGIAGLALSIAIGSGKASASANNFFPEFSLEESTTDSINVKNLDDYVIQGVTPVEDKIFITAYHSEGDKSKIFIYDSNYKFIKEIYTYNNAHVGGIAYDDVHQIVWITDINGTISGYRYSNIMNSETTAYPLYKQVNVSNKLYSIYGGKAAAYVQYHDNKIYVGNFANSKYSVLKSYNINDNGSLDLSSEKISEFLASTQGISFFDKDDKTYICASTSFGRHFDSRIKIMKYDESIENYKTSKTINLDVPPMLEEINISNDGKMITVFESNAEKYKNANLTVDDLVVSNINDVIENNYKSL